MGQFWSRHQKKNDQITPIYVYKCIWFTLDDYLISAWNDNIYQMHYIFHHPLDSMKMWLNIMDPIENKNQTFNTVVLLDTNVHNELVAICNEKGYVALLSKDEGFNNLETRGSVAHNMTLKFNPSGTLLLLATYFGEIHIWDVKSRKLRICRNINSIIKDMDWQTDNVFAVANGYKIDIHKYNDTDCTTTRISRKEHTGFVNGIQWDETGTYLASRSDDKTVKIWTRQSATYIQNLQQHTDYISDIKWCKNSSSIKFMIASASYDGTILLWYLRNSDNPICISIGTPIEIIDFNITGQYLAVGCENKVVVFEIDTTTKLLEYSTKKCALSFAWNRGGKKLAACIEDIGINVYDIETNNVICIK